MSVDIEEEKKIIDQLDRDSINENQSSNEVDKEDTKPKP